MNKVNILFAAALCFLTLNLDAQVKFKLSYDHTAKRYVVSIIPQATYRYPQNITGTGQVTIKVPTNQFFPVDIESYLEGMDWDANSRSNSPVEAPGFDYISFGLSVSGVAFPEYQAGQEMKLFSFENAYGCNGTVYLVDNATDPFMPPNSVNANIGNTLTIMGAGGDAYAGIEGSPACDCNSISNVKEAAAATRFSVFPNPAIEFTSVEIKWEGETTPAFLQVIDAGGKRVVAREIELWKGQNTERLQVENLAAGNYMVVLMGSGWELNIGKFSKVSK